MNDACYRRIQTLRLIPKAPTRISVSQLHEKLVGHGFDIDVRSVQRDVNSLANLFAIENDGNKDIPGWYWRKDAEKLELPEMEPAVALSFRMVKSFLDRFMPPSTLDELGDYFNYAEQVLSNLPDNHLADWTNKIAVLSRNQPLLSPTIADDILNKVYTALLTDKQLQAVYRPRKEDEAKEYAINPLGLVLVDKVIYLVGTLWEYRDIKQFALHRFESAEVTKDDAMEYFGFDLQKYIKQGQFEYLIEEEKTIKLKLVVSEQIAFHLTESPLAENQTIKPEKDTGRLILRAEVKNTQQLRWWLMSFGDGVEVISPNSLREEFKKTTRALMNKYLESRDKSF